jgi:hypothetical protein
MFGNMIGPRPAHAVFLFGLVMGARSIKLILRFRIPFWPKAES